MNVQHIFASHISLDASVTATHAICKFLVRSLSLSPARSNGMEWNWLYILTNITCSVEMLSYNEK